MQYFCDYVVIYSVQLNNFNNYQEKDISFWVLVS